MTRTAFVTGGTGFVGHNLVRQLVAEDWRVTVLHRPSSDLRYLQGLPVSLAAGDLTDGESLLAAMPDAVDAVFHVASDLNFWAQNNAQQTANNVDGTRHLVEAALQRGAKRFVYTSTLGTYGDQPGVITERSAQLGAQSSINYSRTKWAAEEVVREGVQRGLNAVIMNPGGIFGPFDRTTWGAFFFLVRDGLLPYVPDTGLMTWCHVQDVVAAHIVAAEKGRPGHNYILGGAEADLWDVLGIMAELLGTPLKAHRLPSELVLRYAQVESEIAVHTGRPPIYTPEVIEVFASTYRCDDQRAKTELGYSASPLRKMIGDSHAWLAAEGLL